MKNCHTRPVMLALSLACMGGLAACATADTSAAAAAQASAPVTQMVDYFADNGLGNAVAVVQHPAGEHVNGVTYVSYQGPLEDPYVAAYNHNSGEWAGPVKAGVSAMGKDPSRKIDNHGKPTMIVDKAGYIHIFYGGHGGTPALGENRLGNHHYGENKHAVSKRPYDISEWEDLDTIPPFGTYNQVVKMDNGDIYLFYRHGAHRSDWVYHKSTDNGRTFGQAVSFLKTKRRTDVGAVDSWYPYVSKGKGDEIIVSFDYHLCWDGASAPDSRGHTANRQDLFYMVFDTGDGSWRNVEGEQLPMPLTREMAEEKALVARSNGLWTFNGTSTLDPSGHPHIGITMGEDLGPEKGGATGGPKQMRYFRWTGSEWAGGQPTELPIGNGDIIAESNTHARFLLDWSTPSRGGAISWWETRDGGKSFTLGRTLFEKPGVGFQTSAFVRNAHPDARVIVAEYPKGTSNRFMYLVGDNGPVSRRNIPR